MKLKTLLFSAFLLFGVTTIAFAQDNDPAFTIVQEMPKFTGDINQYIAQHILYPADEQKKGIQGKVYINFIVEKDGSVSNVKVLRGVANGPGLDAEAQRVVAGMPKWTPGMQNGKAVRVYFNIPINFVLK